MCSIVLKVLFLGGLIAGVGLTCVALATTYWRNYDQLAHIGLFKQCLGKSESTYCYEKSWNDMQPWHKAVVALLSMTLLISLFAFGWWALACIGCCCQNFLTPPLPILALVLLGLDLAAVITYASCYTNETGKPLASASTYGYSFWCAVGAVCGFATTMVVGCGLVAMTKSGRERTAYRSI